MTLQFHGTILLSTILLSCPRLMVSQTLPTNLPTLTQSEAVSLIKDLASHEEAWEQSCRRIAAIYREMAVPVEADSAALRELKHHYERLAEDEERAAATAAERMAAYHAKLTALIRRSPDPPKHANLGDSAYRR
jgi:hypothetical protein